MAAVIILGGCNTTIGVGRDLREGYEWTRDKISEPSSGGGGYDSGYDGGTGYDDSIYGAPVY